jgi:ubiquinone/menaquinone biosynthesis C-methylase UbiE
MFLQPRLNPLYLGIFILKFKRNLMFTVGTTNETNRVEWIESALKKIPAGSSLLDVGAGECQFKKFCTHLKYTSQDFAQYDGSGDVGMQTGSWDTSRIDIVSDITSIPRPDASFDAIMCTEVLEHVPDPVASIVEMDRLLKKGGYMLITAPFASLTHFAPYHFASGLSRFFYEHHLNRLGYEIMDITLNGNYFEFIAQEVRRVKRVAQQYSGKRMNIFEKAITHLFLYSLKRFSRTGHSSNELLCYGVQILARKK